ncbi:hypothetical protein FCV25MIE_09517 [Fagus crenata]
MQEWRGWSSHLLPCKLYWRKGYLQGNQHLQFKQNLKLGNLDSLEHNVDILEHKLDNLARLQGDGEQPPMVELGEPIPVGAEARNAMPGRPPTHEVFQNLNPPRQPRQFGEPIEPRPFRPNGDPFLTR